MVAMFISLVSAWGIVCGVLCLVIGVRESFSEFQHGRPTKAEKASDRVVFMVLALSGAVTTFVTVMLASAMIFEL